MLVDFCDSDFGEDPVTGSPRVAIILKIWMIVVLFIGFPVNSKQ